ncbi:dipeptidyl peptidase 4 isoform X2 [Chironomus tepperi]|uniref:dipeptidyl peptidase 4 isoform X2 n=1 Tax=Chironomus tepperi TaxID=113505 RepID=UPI00391F0BB4
MTTSNSLETMRQSDQELIGSAKRKRQFLVLGGLCILAIVVILAIVLSVFLVNKSTDEKLDDIVLDDIIKGKLQPKRFNGTWIDDKSFYYFDVNGDFVIYNAESKNREIRVNTTSSIYERFMSSSSFEFSPDKKYILLTASIIKLYRHSFFASWRIFDIAAGTITDVKISEEDDSPIYRLVKFGPVNSSLIIVDKYNIYYKQSPTSESVQITKDGDLSTSHKIINGVPDWVYEEEVFSSNSATWFSNDGKKIAFIQFDDSTVPTITLPIYGLPGQYKYPELIPVSYPKAGANNPNVKLFYVNLEGAIPDNLPEIKKPESLQADQYLITSVGWANGNDLISVWMNRIQNRGLILKCISSNNCENLLTLDTDEGWIEFFTPPVFNGDGTEMIFIGSTEGYRHIKVLNLNTKAVSNRTSGKYIVTEIVKFNKNNNVIIYTANTEEDIKAQHVYAVKNVNGAKPACLTCKLFDGQSYYSAEVSESGTYLIINSGGPEVPRSDLYTLKIEGDNIMLADHMEIENNNDYKNLMNRKKVPKKIYDTIKLDEETDASVMMIVPSDLDESRKYPTIVEVYGGPDSSSVSNKYSVEWGTYLSSALDVIYVKIDGRGSGLKSDKHLQALYKNLGTVEVDDQVRTVEKLQAKYPYLDTTRAGIWGWSYGGYVSGMSLMRDNNVYKCAVSVAPVTDWELYDSIYTERYMLTPNDNPAAYNVSRMANFVENIPKYNKLYMLVHGTLDDNVHFQQGMVLSRVLERSDIQFKEITYPDEDHSLAGVRPHLYHSLEKFFKDCFDLSD